MRVEVSPEAIIWAWRAAAHGPNAWFRAWRPPPPQVSLLLVAGEGLDLTKEFLVRLYCICNLYAKERTWPFWIYMEPVRSHMCLYGCVWVCMNVHIMYLRMYLCMYKCMYITKRYIHNHRRSIYVIYLLHTHTHTHIRLCVCVIVCTLIPIWRTNSCWWQPFDTIIELSCYCTNKLGAWKCFLNSGPAVFTSISSQAFPNLDSHHTWKQFN